MSKRKISLYFSLLLPLVLGACADINSQKTDRAILGGESVVNDSLIAKSTVSLGYTSRGRYVSDCTGVIVSQNLILTAGHCLRSVEMNDTDLQIYFGNDLSQLNKELARDTISWIYHRGYEAKYNVHGEFVTAHHDIGLIKIKGTIPEGYQPVKLIGREREIPVGSEITLAGWGAIFEEPMVFAKQLQSTVVKLEKYWQTHLITNQTNGKGACNGDSGGPAFIQNGNGELIVVGVTRGPHGNSMACNKFGEYTSLTANADFLIEAATDLNAEPMEFDNSIGQAAKESL